MSGERVGVAWVEGREGAVVGFWWGWHRRVGWGGGEGVVLLSW